LRDDRDATEAMSEVVVQVVRTAAADLTAGTAAALVAIPAIYLVATIRRYGCDGLPGPSTQFQLQDWIVLLLSHRWRQLLDLSWQFLRGDALDAVRIFSRV